MRRSFSIIEMIFVLGIFALLAAFLFPSLSAVREMARATVCISDLRQLGQAFVLYTGDYDGRFPECGDWHEASSAGWVWCDREFAIEASRGVLFDYTGRVDGVYRCPGNSEARISYTMNHTLDRQPISFFPNTVLLVEESEAAFGGRGPNDGVFYADHTREDFLTKRHRGGGHFLFTDGRVHWQDAAKRFDLGLFGGGG